MTNDTLINWLAGLTQTTSPYFAVYNFLIQTTIYLSATALLIMLFKLILKNKLSAKWHVLIWAILLVRFVVPNLPSSSFSVFNNAKVDEQVVTQSSYLIINNDSDEQDENIEEESQNIYKTFYASQMNENMNANNDDNITSSGFILRIDGMVSLVWAGGVVLLLGYFIVVLSVYNRKLKKSRKSVDDITLEILSQCKEKLKIKRDVKVYFAETTPMLIGLFRPTIYIPDGNSESEVRDTLLHELSHMKNFDILWSMLATMLLCLNWFNPIMWVSFFMFKRDIEVFCDERTLRYADDKQSYARLLLKTATARKEKFVLGTTSLQSGKADVKRRIKYMAKFREPAVATVVIAAILISILSACCLTNPLKDKIDVTLTNPVNGCRIDFVIDRNLAKSDIDHFYNMNYLQFESDLTVEEILDSLLEDNSNQFGGEMVGEKEALIKCDDLSSVPFLFLTKEVRDKSGKELDDVVFLKCLGFEGYNYDYNAKYMNNGPNIPFGFYFPEYLAAGYRYDNYTETSHTFNPSNPFTDEIQLIDSEDNFNQLNNFYAHLYAYTTTKEDENGGGEILIEDIYSGNPLFKIFYNGKEKTVRFKAYAAFAAESAKGVIKRLENAINRQDRELLASCFKDFTDEDYKKFSRIDKYLVFNKLTIGKFDNAKKVYYFNTLANIEFNDSNIEINEYAKHFQVEYIGEDPKITYTDLANDGDFVADYYSPDKESPNLFINETLGEPDFSEVDSIAFSELPGVIYADDNTAIISGDCGIVVYDLKQRAVTLWASYQYLQELGMTIPFGIASADGKQVYIRDGAEDIASSESVNENYNSLILDVEKRTIKSATGDFHETFERHSIYNLSAIEKSAYDIIEGYVGDTYVTFKKNIVYTQCAEPVWDPRQLSLVKFNKATGRKEEYNIFPSSTVRRTRFGAWSTEPN